MANVQLPEYIIEIDVMELDRVVDNPDVDALREASSAPVLTAAVTCDCRP